MNHESFIAIPSDTGLTKYCRYIYVSNRKGKKSVYSCYLVDNTIYEEETLGGSLVLSRELGKLRVQE